MFEERGGGTSRRGDGEIMSIMKFRHLLAQQKIHTTDVLGMCFPLSKVVVVERLTHPIKNWPFCTTKTRTSRRRHCCVVDTTTVAGNVSNENSRRYPTVLVFLLVQTHKTPKGNKSTDERLPQPTTIRDRCFQN